MKIKHVWNHHLVDSHLKLLPILYHSGDTCRKMSHGMGSGHRSRRQGKSRNNITRIARPRAAGHRQVAMCDTNHIYIYLIYYIIISMEAPICNMIFGSKKKSDLVWNPMPSWIYLVVAKENHISTLPETNIAHENPIFPGKYHHNGGCSMAMLVSGRVFSKQFMESFWEVDWTFWSFAPGRIETKTPLALRVSTCHSLPNRNLGWKKYSRTRKHIMSLIMSIWFQEKKHPNPKTTLGLSKKMSIKHDQKLTLSHTNILPKNVPNLQFFSPVFLS